MDTNDRTGCVFASKGFVCLFWNKYDNYNAGRRAVFGGIGCAFFVARENIHQGAKRGLERR